MDLVKFLLYFEKCILRSVIVCFFVIMIGVTWGDIDGAYDGVDIVLGVKGEDQV